MNRYTENDPQTSAPGPDGTSDKLHPEQRKSVFDRLDKRDKIFGATALAAVILGAGFGLGFKSFESSQTDNTPFPSQPTARASVVPGLVEAVGPKLPASTESQTPKPTNKTIKTTPITIPAVATYSSQTPSTKHR